MSSFVISTENIISPYTTRLFSRPSFLEGMGRIFDFMGLLNDYQYDKTEKEADLNALRSDWFAVGDDIRTAIKTYVGVSNSRTTE